MGLIKFLWRTRTAIEQTTGVISGGEVLPPGPDLGLGWILGKGEGL